MRKHTSKASTSKWSDLWFVLPNYEFVQSIPLLSPLLSDSPSLHAPFLSFYLRALWNVSLYLFYEICNVPQTKQKPSQLPDRRVWQVMQVIEVMRGWIPQCLFCKLYTTSLDKWAVGFPQSPNIYSRLNRFNIRLLCTMFICFLVGCCCCVHASSTYLVRMFPIFDFIITVGGIRFFIDNYSFILWIPCQTFNHERQR